MDSEMLRAVCFGLMRVCKRFEPVKAINQNNNTKLVAFFFPLHSFRCFTLRPNGMHQYVYATCAYFDFGVKAYAIVSNEWLENMRTMEDGRNHYDLTHNVNYIAKRSWKICIRCRCTLVSSFVAKRIGNHDARFTFSDLVHSFGWINEQSFVVSVKRLFVSLSCIKNDLRTWNSCYRFGYHLLHAFRFGV